MSRMYTRAFRTKWLGTPGTGPGVVPPLAGLPMDAGVRILDLRLYNRATAAAALALVGLLKDSAWVAGQWTEVGSVFTDDTADAQDADTGDFPLETLTLNDGFVVAADAPFGAISLELTVNGVGGTAHDIAYWNGSSWNAIPTIGALIDIPSRAGVWTGTGEQLTVFIPPADWVPGGAVADRYNIRIRQTAGVPTTAATARRIYVGEVFWSDDAIGANGETLIQGLAENPLQLPSYIAALGYATSNADDGNTLVLVLA